MGNVATAPRRGWRHDMQAAWEAARLAVVPTQWADELRRRLEEKQGAETLRDANLWLLETTEKFQGIRIPLNASDSDICRQAEDCAAEVMALAQVSVGAEQLRDKASAYCERWGIEPPKREGPGAVEDRPAIARMTEALWWRRKLRAVHARNIEAEAIRLGYVHRRAAIYCSDETLNRRMQQRRRNADMLKNTVAVNEEGDEFTLAELAAKSTANPEIRRGELMVRVSGFEKIAKASGDVCEFVTGTCPPRMHSRNAADGSENQGYDGTTPREAQAFLASVCWARTRSALDRAGIRLYGFRVAEPHHDGCPHWHMLFFLPPWVSIGRRSVPRFRAILRRYWLNADDKPLPKLGDLKRHYRAMGMQWRHAELLARDDLHRMAVDQARERRGRQARSGELAHRVKFVSIDMGAEGGAAGYLAKYISKSIDGKGLEVDLFGQPIAMTTARVEAWASTWGIRQFQQIGGPAVGVWRELRRVKDEAPSNIVEAARAAAGIGQQSLRGEAWAEYVQVMGGAVLPRKLRPVAVAKVAAYQKAEGAAWVGHWVRAPKLRGRLGRYLEVGQEIIGLVCRVTGAIVHSVRRLWEIRRGHGNSMANKGRGGAVLSGIYDGGKRDAGNEAATSGVDTGNDAGCIGQVSRVNASGGGRKVGDLGGVVLGRRSRPLGLVSITVRGRFWKVSIAERAAALKRRTDVWVRQAGWMLPDGVKDLITAQAEMLSELAAEVEALRKREGGNHGG